jgi:hypothetical protein
LAGNAEIRRNSLILKDSQFPDSFPDEKINNLRGFSLEIANYLTIYPHYAIIYLESEKLPETK